MARLGASLSDWLPAPNRVWPALAPLLPKRVWTAPSAQSSPCPCPKAVRMGGWMGCCNTFFWPGCIMVAFASARLFGDRYQLEFGGREIGWHVDGQGFGLRDLVPKLAALLHAEIFISGLGGNGLGSAGLRHQDYAGKGRVHHHLQAAYRAQLGFALYGGDDFHFRRLGRDSQVKLFQSVEIRFPHVGRILDGAGLGKRENPVAGGHGDSQQGFQKLEQRPEAALQIAMGVFGHVRGLGVLPETDEASGEAEQAAEQGF